MRRRLAVPPHIMLTRVIRIERWGPPEALVEREVVLPEPAAGEVHLRVDAAGVNFADLMMRAGLYSTVPPRPFSPGFEVAGRVVAVGAGVDGWTAGDRAVGLLRHGGYARDVVLRADQLFRYPDSLSPVEAAAVPVNFLTAWVCLFAAGAARSGERVLVLGAGGGVGTAAVQLGLAEGLRVVGTAGTEEKRRFVVDELGADACFDSRGAWPDQVLRYVGERGLDLALDPVGGRATAACRDLLAPLGRLVLYGLSAAAPGSKRSWLRAAWAWLRTPRFHAFSLVEPSIGIHGVHLLHLQQRQDVLQELLPSLLRRVAEGELTTVVDTVYPLDRDGAVAAHRRLHARGNLGKVVLARDEARP